MVESPLGLPPYSDASRLLGAARNGSDEARGQLLDLYWKYLVALAADEVGGQLRRKVAPSDVAQETLVRVDQNFDKFSEGSVREWEAWLRTIALNTIADLRRRYTRRKRDIRRELSLDDVESRSFLERMSALGVFSSDRLLEDREFADRTLDSVQALRRSHQAAILWHFRDGLTVAQIAAKLERSEDAVRMLLHRAVAALREHVRTANGP